MKRRHFLQCAAASLAAVSSATRDTLAQPAPEFRWRMATSWPAGAPILDAATRRLADNLNRLSGGRLQVSVDPATKHKAPFGVLDMVRTGAYQLGHTPSYYYKGKDPAMQFFTTVPFGMTLVEQGAWFDYGGGNELMRRAFARHGVAAFNCGNSGYQMGGWFKKEVRSLKDLKGLRMRIPGLAGEVLERLGVKPVNIAPGETYTALERGVVDAVEWIAPYNDAAMGLHRIAPFYYTGWHEPCAEIQLIVNRDAFAVLPEDLKAMIPVAAKAARLDTQSEFFYRNAVSWQAMAQEGRVKLRTFPDDVIAALRRESQALLGELARSSPELKEILDGQSAFLKRARVWTRFTEQAYLRIR